MDNIFGVQSPPPVRSEPATEDGRHRALTLRLPITAAELGLPLEAGRFARAWCASRRHHHHHVELRADPAPMHAHGHQAQTVGGGRSAVARPRIHGRGRAAGGIREAQDDAARPFTRLA